MSAVYPRRRVQDLLALAAALLAAAAIVSTGARSVRAAETVFVAIDNAKLMRVPDRTATIVIGNPLIADVSLQTGGVLVVTGKGYGTTNFLALDRAGNVIAERELLVHASTERIVSVYYGVDRATLSCEPQCQPRVMLGDAPAFFNSMMQQTGARNGASQGGANSGGAPAAPR